MSAISDSDERKELSICTAHSPSIEHKKLDLQLKLKEERYDNEIKSCCSRTGTTDRRLVRYGTKVFLSIVVISFCFYQIMNAGPCDTMIAWYCSLVSGILGTWMKLPNIKADSE